MSKIDMEDRGPTRLVIMLCVYDIAVDQDWIAQRLANVLRRATRVAVL